MNFSIHAEAREEFYASTAFYERQRDGLGTEFARAVASALLRIVQFPESGAQDDTGLRRVRVKRFPFVVFYRIKPSEIRVLAIMHSHREPQYWERRS